MSAPPSPIKAIRAHLLDSMGVTDICDERVFGVEIPEDMNDGMPTPTVVVTRSGGLDVIGQGYQDYGDIRVDVRCYGATPFAAEQLHLEVYAAMKHMRRTTYEGCVLHWARSSGGALNLRDPDTDWPFTFSSWQVLVGELSAV